LRLFKISSLEYLTLAILPNIDIFTPYPEVEQTKIDEHVELSVIQTCPKRFSKLRGELK